MTVDVYVNLIESQRRTPVSSVSRCRRVQQNVGAAAANNGYVQGQLLLFHTEALPRRRMMRQ